MTIFRAGAEDFDWIQSGGAGIGPVVGRSDAAYTRHGVRAGVNTGDSMQIEWGADVSTLYMTMRLYGQQVTANTADGDLFHFFSPSGVAMVRVNGDNGVYHTDVIVGASLATVNTWSPTLIQSTLQKVSCKIVLDAVNGEVSFWINDVLASQFLGDTVGSTGETLLDRFRVTNPGSVTEATISEIIFADEDVSNLRVATLAPSGIGNQFAWTGGFADVDEETESQADLLTTATPDDVELMALTNYGGSTLFEVKDVFVSVKSRGGTADFLQLEDGTGNLLIEDPHTVGDSLLLESSIPSQIQAAVREGVTDGFGASQGLETLFHSQFTEFLLNPDTGAPWTLAELDTMEAGVKAIT